MYLRAKLLHDSYSMQNFLECAGTIFSNSSTIVYIFRSVQSDLYKFTIII